MITLYIFSVPIFYPGSAGFLTGAVVGLMIGLSFQHAAIPVQKMKAVVCMAYDGLDVSDGWEFSTSFL